jgi:Spy/CpxP family protein refolding chaperone
MLDRASKDLNLTPEQQQKLLANRQAQKTAMAAVREKMRAARMGLKQEFEKESPDKGRLEQLNAEMKACVGEMIDLRFQGMEATRETLSADQFRKLGEKVEAGRHTRGERLKERFRSFRENRSGEKGQGGAQ